MIEVLEVGLKEMIDNPNLIFVYWYITGACNYSCDYCDVFRSEPIQSWETKQNIIDYLNYLDTKKDLRVLLYGGEPTLDPDLPKVIQYLTGYVRLFTNLYKDLDYWKNLVKVRQDMTISASYHLTKVNEQDFLKKIRYLVEETGVNKVRIKVMADSRYREKSMEVYNIYKDLYDDPRYECFLDLILKNSEGETGAGWNDKDMDWYLDLQQYDTVYLKYIEDGVVKEKEISWNEVRNTLVESNHYYHCMAGVNLLFIESDGNVYLCKSRRHDPIFNVKDKFVIPDEGIICDYMGFCCEVDFPKKLVCKRIIGEQTKVIRNKLL